MIHVDVKRDSDRAYPAPRFLVQVSTDGGGWRTFYDCGRVDSAEMHAGAMLAAFGYAGLEARGTSCGYPIAERAQREAEERSRLALQARQDRERVEQLSRCVDCGNEVEPLSVFPGPRCLDCWRPIGDAEASTMTAEKLARMWGGGR